MVVFIDGTADRTERIMAICKRIRKRKFLQPARFRRLDDADICDVMRSDRIKFKLEVLAERPEELLHTELNYV